MPNVITINTAELAVGHNDDRLKTGSVGSCVVIALYDPVAKVGGLAHAMLARRRGGSDTDSDAQAKYVPEAIEHLIAALIRIGGKKNRFVAKLVGGASMFQIFDHGKDSIGSQNVQAARDCLADFGIPVESEDTGGTIGRLVEFDLVTGRVEVNTKM